MNPIRSLLLLLALLALSLTVLLAGATGVGVLLNRLMPEIGLGTSVLIGTVALSISLHFVLGVLGQAHSVQEELDEAELEELITTMQRPARRRRSRR